MNLFEADTIYNIARETAHHAAARRKRGKEISTKRTLPYHDKEAL
jgi:hypothetical protein